MSYIIATLDDDHEIEILKHIKYRDEALAVGKAIASSAYIDIAIYETTGDIGQMELKLIALIPA